ncbi:MAG: hypothetical protein NTX82_06870 [Candidatus Parcubacteria bacterium]|nr:hypothetical protein [Candidatus Parcubacteria bacterium]
MLKHRIQNLLILLLLGISYLLFHQVKAGLVSDFSDQLSSQTIATAANHEITFTTSSDWAPDKTLEVYFDTGFDLTQIDYTDIDLLDDGANKNLGLTAGTGVGGNIGAVISGQTITFTQNDTDTIASGSIITIKIGTNASHQVVGDKHIYNPDIAGAYYISLSGSFGDMGTISTQILTTDMVGFTGTIEPSISFELRNSDDNGVFTGCNFGVISHSAVSECSYRLAPETNLPTGFQVFIQADGNLSNSQATIANITEDQIVTAGTEGYGLALTAGTGMIKAGDYSDDDTPVSSTGALLLSANSVYNYIQGDLSTSALITLRLAVSPQTKAGFYNQLISYSILGNF